MLEALEHREHVLGQNWRGGENKSWRGAAEGFRNFIVKDRDCIALSTTVIFQPSS